MKSNLTTLPEWLTRKIITAGMDSGADDEDNNEDDTEDEDNEDEDEDEDSEEDESDEDEDEDGEDEDKDKPKEDPSAGLKSALRKERKGHKLEKRGRIEAENKLKDAEAKLAGVDGKESDAVATIQKELDSERTKTTSLAGKIKDQAIRSAIIAEATRQKFIDPEDAMSVAKAIEADQDADDPTDIDIDEDSVKEEVEKLAKRKKHLVGTGETKKTSTTKSGSKSTRRRKTKTAPNAKLLEDYPSLR